MSFWFGVVVWSLYAGAVGLMLYAFSAASLDKVSNPALRRMAWFQMILLLACGAVLVLLSGPASADVVVASVTRSAPVVPDNAWGFMHLHPWQTFWLGFWVLVVLCIVVELIATLHKRSLSRQNIRDRGWPPAHCDAMGNLAEKDGGDQ